MENKIFINGKWKIKQYDAKTGQYIYVDTSPPANNTVQPSGSGFSFSQTPNITMTPQTQNLNMSQPGLTPLNTGGTSTNKSSGNVFTNLMSSLTPNVYADDGSYTPPAPIKSGGDVLGASTWASTPTSYKSGNTIGDLGAYLNKAIGDIGTSISSKIGAPTGTWWNMPEYGVTEKPGQFANFLLQPIIGDTNKGPNSGGYSSGTSYIAPKTDVPNSSNDLLKGMIDRMGTGTKNLTSDVNARNATTGSLGSRITTELTNIDSFIQDKMNGIEAERQSGKISNQEAAQKNAALQEEANNLVFNQLIAEQESQKPLIENEFNTSKATLDESTGLAKREGEAVKAQNTNVYGNVMRKMVGNKDITQRNINDVFSAAGAAGGSQYLNAISQSERDTGNNVAQSETELANTNSAIDRQQQNFELTVKDKINQLVLEKDKQLNVIANNINMSKAQKLAASKEVNINLNKQLQDIEMYHQQQTDAFINLKEQMLANTGELAKNTVTSDMLYNKSGTGTPTTYNAGTNPMSIASNPNTTKRLNQFGQTEEFINGRWQVVYTG